MVVVDNYVVYLNRGGKGSIFVEEIFEVLKVRGWDVVGGFFCGF